MNGMEAKYTAKHLAKIIKRNRVIQKKSQTYFDVRSDDPDYLALDKLTIAGFLQKQLKGMSLEFRAFMIHNAFKKNRSFTSAEVAYFNLGENALAAIKQDKVAYSRYMDRRKRQQKAIAIVRHTMLNTTEHAEFDVWLENNSKFETWFKDKVLEAIEE